MAAHTVMYGDTYKNTLDLHFLCNGKKTLSNNGFSCSQFYEIKIKFLTSPTTQIISVFLNFFSSGFIKTS